MNKIIIGSGLSVLGFLNSVRDQKNWICLDKNDYYGGHAYSHKIKENYFDEGAHICHSQNAFFKNFFNISDNNNHYIKSNVVNYYKSKKIGYPVQLNLYDLELKDKISFLFDYIFMRKKTTNNYFDWLVNNYGTFLSEKFYRTYTEKYWRTNPEEMSNDWVSKRLIKKNFISSIKSIFFKPKSGEAVFNYFLYPKRGGFFNIFNKKYINKNIQLKKKITKIYLKNKTLLINNEYLVNYDKLVSSIPLVDYLDLIDEIPSNVVESLKSLKYTKLICYNLKIKKRIKYNFHWCYFYDKSIPFSRMSILSNLKNSNIDKDFYVVQGEVFRRNDENYDLIKLDKQVEDHLRDFFKLQDNNDIIFNEKKIIDKAYPVPLIDTKKNVKTIINWLEENNLKQIGLYGKWNYLWSDQSFIDGWNEGLNYNKNEKQ
jgi:protoporphyrinogen oxidase